MFVHLLIIMGNAAGFFNLPHKHFPQYIMATAFWEAKGKLR